MYACVIFYNDRPSMLEECFKRIKGTGMGLIAVDGAFSEFPTSDERSVSVVDCYDIAQKYADCLIKGPSNGGWATQVQKRNAYLEVVPERGYFFVLDADEWLHPFDSEFIEKHMMERELEGLPTGPYRVQENRFDEEGSGTISRMSTVRVYKKTPGLQYRNRHCEVWDGKIPLITPHGPGNGYLPMLMTKDWIPIQFDHRKDLRSPERRRAKNEYYQKREEARKGYND